MQAQNPLGYTCAPNGAGPDYVTETNFRRFVAFGLMHCWFGSGDDPNEYCNFSRPFTKDDVKELRYSFLRMVNKAVGRYWDKENVPGEGDIDTESTTVFVRVEEDADEATDFETRLWWSMSFNNEEINFELNCMTDISVEDSQYIGLAYEALYDRQNVVKVLEEAWKTIGNEAPNWLRKLAAQQPKLPDTGRKMELTVVIGKDDVPAKIDQAIDVVRNNDYDYAQNHDVVYTVDEADQDRITGVLADHEDVIGYSFGDVYDAEKKE
jgi:hypothetical protein